MQSEHEIDPILEEDDNSESLYERLSITVDKGQAPIRVDKFLMTKIVGGTRNRLQAAIKNGMVLINGKEIKSNHKIKPLDELLVYTDNTPGENTIIPQDIPLDIRFEDAEIMMIHKPAGMVVHPGSGNRDGTLVNGIAYYLSTQNPEISEDSLPRFGLVHRIDKNTSGLLVVAKTAKAMKHLAKQFFDHTVDRKYVALVWGDMEEEKGTITGHIGRHKRFKKLFDIYPEGDYGKDATTHYQVLEKFGYTSLVECKLETGRTHQIRVHMKSVGHPIFNDDFYGGDKIAKGTIFTKYRQFIENCFALCPRQALHAKTLGFIHPDTEEYVFFDTEIPDDMQACIAKWRNYIKTKS